MRHLHLAAAAALIAAGPALAQNRIDLIRPDAPELAAHGSEPIGVRNIEFTDPDRIDVTVTTETGTETRGPRRLTAEIWYPAAQGTQTGGTYTTLLRDGETEVALAGRAARDAQVADGEYPLVILSHGYPGNRMLMSHLAENLASKGYVVVSADHPESTYDDMGLFTSTLVNRAVDQRFLLDSMAGLEGDLGAATDADNAAVIGYSMGGYGALIFGGAGLSKTAVERAEPERFVPPKGLLDRLASGSAEHDALVDPRIKAVVAIAPWGRQHEFWDAGGLAKITKPLMLVAGSDDDVSVYDAIRDIFAQTTGTTRHLLTFEYANHNAAAPMPAPAEAWQMSQKLGWAPFEHYADPVWDTVRMNNVLQHFATAFLDLHLKGDAAAGEYLDLVPDAADGVWSADAEGNPDEANTYWKGFANRTAKGLSFETREAGK
ncbi:dienelactone hydrolase [Paracoccus sp. 1_MG-2023]|uniref:alpha/beta hydrolase family protein n=1 Tax=unclassified Paracoccus (in: a-proteobacteria) TaxID=2688777 RepID=UPI001C08E1B8|nr:MULTISPECIES: alpha/beta fold hydrolase [unclassified Paracoccus (in: a-proteobacteria)]MBU2956438.1 dienelactone hydrolase [Paracoccus sp. C2R09]MDO6669828.1 dienelactone hydrolase [Paracoccus sp. 1_MG-2023]